MAFEFKFIPFFIAYLVGAIPTSVWVGQIFYGIDVRDFGSGNAGATNTMRVLGKKAGIPVLVIDILKGFAAVNIAHLVGGYIPGTEKFISLQVILGLGALLGHIFPVYVGFRGGKGIATLLGIVLALHYPAALLSVSVFIAVLLITGFVSLSSILAALMFPLALILIFATSESTLVIFSFFVSILVLITHQRNLERLLRGEESKARILRNRNATAAGEAEEAEDEK